MAIEPNKRQQQYQATLERIRLAVDKLVEEMGFDQMRIQDICKEAEISPGNFYHYFTSKQALLFDRYQRCNDFLWTLYQQTLIDMDALEGLYLLTEQMIDYTRTRQLDILIPYHQAMTEDFLQWQKAESSAFVTIAGLLIEKSRVNQLLNDKYTNEEIARFISNIVYGTISHQCMTKGEALSDNTIALMTKKWIEELRKS